MRFAYIKPSALALMLLLSFGEIQSQTHLKLILKTSLPVDSAVIVHFTNMESSRLAFKDTLELDFKTGKADYYHINYIREDKIFNEKIYADSGNVTISMKIENDKLVIDKVIGSPLFENTQTWKKQYASVKLAKDTSAVDSFLLKTYEEQIENMFSFSIGMTYLNLHQNDKLKLYALLPLLARQSIELKKQFGFTMLNDRLQGIIRNNTITLPGFELIDPANKIVHATAMNTEFVILDFWFVGCIPCMEDHEKIKGLLRFLKQKQAELISISNDDSYKTWKGYLKKHDYPWRHYKKPPARENIISQLGISVYPTYILLNKKGQIVFSSYSLEEVLNQL